MGVSNRKLQVALFTDPSRPLPTVDEFASYVVNMGPPMNTHALALAIPEGNTNNPHDHNVSRTAQFARAVQEEQEKQQQFLITPSPSHSSTDLNPSPESYIPPFEQNQSYDPAMYGYAGLHSSVSQPPVSDAASALLFQPAGPFDQYNVNPPSNGYDLSAANYMSETHSISPSPGYLDTQFSIHSQGIYMPPEYSQMANVDPSSYGALMENSLATQDYGYTPQSISADMYYGLESGHGQPSGTYLPNL
ncbi:uncharacterized protein EI90DRAFT_3037383 [Cantharellus anzutake]|uniref:uncharacterized protein n=1 Tax=Cantharellus anzutake TaxID=1750568 RepID=UPI001905AD94|nr:uncharacterized protein EI90DRAFT_3037383 [Cantharellus anzutake]KAF8339656.1 hypothetical protein EI90DRAFT_3037383 [Cantharellus anzutake]